MNVDADKRSENRLPPIKRHIVSNDTVTRSSTYIDSPELQYKNYPGFANVARSYATEVLPAYLSNEEDVGAYKGTDSIASFNRVEIVVPNEGTGALGKAGGANMVILDLHPGAIGHMHRTVSIDFAICVHGEIDHELDNGETIRLYPGFVPNFPNCFSTDMSRDHVIQRATMHRWINASQVKPARLIAVILPCEPLEVAGELVKETHIYNTSRFVANQRQNKNTYADEI
jgi:hypothetical protein